MSEPDALMPAFLFAFAGALGAVMFASWGHLGYGVGGMALCALVSACRRRTLAGVIETAGGALYIGLPCGLFVWLRDRDPEGLATILVLFAVIWSADIFAYFGGKLIGGPKIAEGLSPNKTWSGIIAGVLAGAVAGWMCGAMVAPPGTPSRSMGGCWRSDRLHRSYGRPVRVLPQATVRRERRIQAHPRPWRRA